MKTSRSLKSYSLLTFKLFDLLVQTVKEVVVPVDWQHLSW